MTKRGTLFIGLSASVLMCVPIACSSSSDTTGSGGSAGGTGGSTTTGGSTASGGTTATGGSTAAGGSAGSTTTGAGGSTVVNGVCSGDPSPNPDYTPATTGMCTLAAHQCCNTTDAKTSAFCSQSCCLGCGFLYNGVPMGTKTCSCPPGGGTFTACPCPKPAMYMGAAFAPSCLTKSPTGYTIELKDQPCNTLWDECIVEDPPTSATLQGCVCVPNPKVMDGGTLGWVCGSTNKWFDRQL